jgi:hypothetical protein
MGEGATNDYVATGSNQAVFNEVVLDDDVITLLVVSVDLYNPAWNSVNADILPTLTATYSIGSALKKFTTGFFSGIVSALSFTGDGANLDDGANGKLTSGTTANKLVRLDGSAKLPAVDGSQLTNLDLANSNYVVIPSMNITTSATGGYTNQSSMTKIQEIQYKNISGLIQVVFSVTGNSNNNAQARIYKNGVAYGTDYSYLIGNGPHIKTENLSFSNNDLIQIYGSGSSGVSVNYFRLCYEKVIKTSTDIINL